MQREGRSVLLLLWVPSVAAVVVAVIRCGAWLWSIKMTLKHASQDQVPDALKSLAECHRWWRKGRK